VTELDQINSFLTHLVQNPKDLFEKDEAYQKFFYQTVAVGAIKALTRERSKDEKVSLPSGYMAVPGRHCGDHQELCASLH